LVIVHVVRIIFVRTALIAKKVVGCYRNFTIKTIWSVDANPWNIYILE
jgi:hypothetical protein